MSLKKKFHTSFANPQTRIDMLYQSAKIMFLSLSFVFFLVYFFVSANFYASVFQPLLFPLYVTLDVSFMWFGILLSFHFFYKKIPLYVLWIISVVWILVAAIFLLPVV